MVDTLLCHFPGLLRHDFAMGSESSDGGKELCSKSMVSPCRARCNAARGWSYGAALATSLLDNEGDLLCGTAPSGRLGVWQAAALCMGCNYLAVPSCQLVAGPLASQELGLGGAF